MPVVFSGLLVSLVVVIALGVLFSYEETHQERFADRVRVRADFYVLKIRYFIHSAYRRITNDLTKQVFRYVYHLVLRVFLSLVTRAERLLRENMRVNKTLAKYADRESTTRSKLEELALHKAETALTGEEKKRHRDKMLEGF